MKSFSALPSLLVLVAVGQAKNLKQDSVQCSHKSGVLWPDYANHEIFYVCTNEGEKVMMTCQAQQKFNFYQQKCVSAVDWQKPPKSEKIIPSSALSETVNINCGEDILLWPVANDESRYYQCIGGEYAVEMQCTFNEIFDFDSQCCAPPFSPQCFAHEISTLWPDPSSHEHFFRCLSVGQSVRERCTEGTYFVFQIQMCVLFMQTTPVIQRAPNCTEDQLSLRWPDPMSDRNYFVCTGIAEYELFSCQIGFIFEFNIQMCIFDEVFMTVTPTVTTEATTFFGQTTIATTRDPFSPLECEEDDLHLFWPVVGYIYDFYICLGPGQPERRNCPPFMIFIFDQQMCIIDPRLPTTTIATTTTLTSITVA